MESNMSVFLTISIEVVKYCHTSFLLPALLDLLSVIRLGASGSGNRLDNFRYFRFPHLPSSVRPVVELVSIGWRQFYLVC